MPDARLDRTRPTLPEGYQFGDAARKSLTIEDYERRYDDVQFRIGETIVVRLPRRVVHIGGWNVIEGDHVK